MKLHNLETIFGVLNDATVDYLVAGGLAINAHGYQRLTHDLDLVIALNKTNIHALFNALASLGYRPTVPITHEMFADSENRQEWFDTKGMRVLNFFSDIYPDTPIDVFVYEPFDIEHEYKAALIGEIMPKLEVRFVSIPTLIAMKEEADRPKDRDDIEHLRWIQEETRQ